MLPADYIYFLRDPDNGTIKVGKTDRGEEFRLRELGAGNSRPLQVLGVIDRRPGITEAGLKLQFRHLKIRREWYRPGADLLDYIRRNATAPRGAARTRRAA